MKQNIRPTASTQLISRARQGAPFRNDSSHDFRFSFRATLFSPVRADDLAYPCKRIFRKFDRDIYGREGRGGVHARLRVLRRSYARVCVHSLVCEEQIRGVGEGAALRIELFIKLAVLLDQNPFPIFPSKNIRRISFREPTRVLQFRESER